MFNAACKSPFVKKIIGEYRNLQVFVIFFFLCDYEITSKMGGHWLAPYGPSGSILLPGRAEICTWVALGFSVSGSGSQVGGENRLLLLILGWEGPECSTILDTGAGLGKGHM